MRTAFLLGLLGLTLAGPATAQTYRGTLSGTDNQLESGEFVDWYTIVAQEGETLLIVMESTSEFDPYLLLRGPNEQNRDNDDAEAGDLVHSRIEHTVTAGGTFQVGATSYVPGETGSYALTIQVTTAGGAYVPTAPEPGRNEITLHGIGPVLLGMTPREAQAAWGSRWVSNSEEVGEAAVDDPRLPPECHYTGPVSNEPGFLVVDGRLAVVSVWSPAYHTPSGIRVGSTIDEVFAAYPGRIMEEPNMYTDEPVLTFVPAEARNSDFRMVFITEGGRVTLIKAGLEIPVNYPEGCH